MMRLTLAVALVGLLVAPATADVWQMSQRDMHNTGRADFSPLADNTFFDNIVWQTKAAGPVKGHQMSFYDGAGPQGGDIVLGTYAWPKGAQGMERYTGAVYWSVNPGGGGLLSNVTCAFSNDGAIVYATNDATPGPAKAWWTVGGPAVNWDNSADVTPGHLAQRSPTIAPDGRIFLHQWNDRPYGATDNPGVALTETWAAGTAIAACFSDPTLYMDGNDLVVVSSGRVKLIRAWDGATGVELWSTATAGKTDANVTIDPANGNIYVGCGENDIWVVGLDINGNKLWDDNMVWDWTDGVNNPQSARATGCLSHDAGTYYFQTNGSLGDGQLYAINTADGSLKWSYATQSSELVVRSSSPIVTPNGIVVVGNNKGDTFYAIQDGGAGNPILVDTLAVNPDANADGRAHASASISADGWMYIATRLNWTKPGDDPNPDGTAQFLYNGFQLTAFKLPGDVDGNGVVDGLDLTAVLTAWETVPGDPLWNENADLDDNNVVDGLDLTEVISNWTVASAAGSDEASDADSKPGRGKGNVRRK